MLTCCDLYNPGQAWLAILLVPVAHKLKCSNSLTLFCQICDVCSCSKTYCAGTCDMHACLSVDVLDLIGDIIELILKLHLS